MEFSFHAPVLVWIATLLLWVDKLIKCDLDPTPIRWLCNWLTHHYQRVLPHPLGKE